MVAKSKASLNSNVIPRGFTLIELLLALVVTSSVIALASYAYSMYSSRWTTKVGNFDEVSSTARALWQTQGVLESMIPMIVKQEKNNKNVFYFLGRDSGATFVTQQPIFNSEGLSVVRVFAESGVAGARLVYEEAPLDGQELKRLNQQLDFEYRLVLLEGMNRIEFNYFGYENSDVAAGDVEVYQKPTWYTEYDGAERMLHPLAIELTIDGQLMRQSLSQPHPNILAVYADE